MLELIGYEKTGGLVLSNIIILIICYACFAKAKVYPFIIQSSTKKYIGIICLLVFFVFAFWGADWFHVAQFYSQIQKGASTHMEDVYVWISQHIAPNYIIFRLIIWGACLWLMKLIFNRINISKDLLWLMFVVFGAVWCSYARVSLSMCLMFYGFAIWNNPYKHKLLSYVLAASCICSAYYFHKTALFGIILIVIALLIKKFNKYTIVIIVISTPILLYLLKLFVFDYVLLDAIGEDGMLGRSALSAQGYMERDSDTVGIGALLLKIFERSAYILTGILAVTLINNKERKRIPIIDAFIRLDIIMVIASCLFLFNIGINTSIIAERFFRFLFIPTGILVAYFWQNNHMPRLTKLCYYLGLSYSSYTLLYSLYMFM